MELFYLDHKAQTESRQRPVFTDIESFKMQSCQINRKFTIAFLCSAIPDLLNLSATSLSFYHENKAHFHMKRSKYEDADAWSNAFGHVPQALFKIKVFKSNGTGPKGAAFQK